MYIHHISTSYNLVVHLIHVYSSSIIIRVHVSDPSVEETSPSCCQSNLGHVDVSLSVILEEDMIDDGMGYIVAPDDSTENITYMCTASHGTVLFQFGGCDVNNVRYQMVDRDEFLNDGIVIQDVQIGVSVLCLRSPALTFLTERLQSNVFTVQCLAVVDDLNVYAGDTYTVELYGMLVGGPVCNVHTYLYVVFHLSIMIMNIIIIANDLLFVYCSKGRLPISLPLQLV